MRLFEVFETLKLIFQRFHVSQHLMKGYLCMQNEIMFDSEIWPLRMCKLE